MNENDVIATFAKRNCRRKLAFVVVVVEASKTREPLFWLCELMYYHGSGGAPSAGQKESSLR